MNDMKKVLIVAISVVLVIAIAAGVSIGVMANTMNGLKDRVEELDQAYASDKAAMMAEIEAAKAANENLVTAADFEAKLAAAIGEQNQTMQALISTAVKNQIEELGTEGLTEEQVQAIIDAAVANCLTEADIDAIVAGVDTGLTSAEVKKIVADYTAGTLTYGQIVNLIDDADYDLRAYLEAQFKKELNEVIAEVNKLGGDLDKLEGDVNTQAGKVASITLTTDDANADDELIIDADVLATLLSGGTLQLYTETWTAVDVIINYEGTMPFNLDGRNATIANLYVYAPNADIIVENLAVNGNVEVLQVPYNTLTFNNIIVKGNLVVEEGHVIVEDSTVENITVDGVANVSIGEDTTVETVVVTENAEDATVSNEGTVSGTITVNADATVTNEGTVTGTIEVNAEATVTNNGTAAKIEVTDENATVENTGKVEEVTGGNYVTYNPEKDGSLDAFVKAAEDGAIIYIPEGAYVTENQIWLNGKSVSLVGIGEVTISTNYTPGATVRVTNSTAVDKAIAENVVVSISNISIMGASNKYGLYIADDVKVVLNGVTISGEFYSVAAIIDNAYVADATSALTVIDSEIDKLSVGVAPTTHAESVTAVTHKDTYAVVDTEDSVIKVIAIDSVTKASSWKNITINKEVPNYNVMATVATDAELKAVIGSADKLWINLLPGEYTVDLYSTSIAHMDSLTINGSGADTKVKFGNLQARLALVDNLTINNCTIERMPDKSWGMIVFGSSSNAGGVYTISDCIFDGVGTQGIYINQTVAATFNIENCTFTGDFGSEGAITVQNNDGVKITVNVTDCAFNKIPETSHEIYVLYAYDGWTLNAEGVTAYWKAN